MDESNLNKEIKGGWVAMQEPYFLSAWVPDQNKTYQYYSNKKAASGENDYNTYIIGFVTPQMILEPGNSIASQSILYIGPENASQLSKIAKGLDLTIDYGWLWPISKLLFTV